MLPEGTGTAGRGGEGAGREGASSAPAAVALIDAYVAARRRFVRTREALEGAACDLLDAERELREHIGREGEAGDGYSVYSLDDKGGLRWRRRPTQPEGWRRYATPLPGPGPRRDA